MIRYSTDNLFGYNMVTMLLLCTLQLHAFIAMELNLG